MRLALIDDRTGTASSVTDTLADADGDGIDDETGEPVPDDEDDETADDDPDAADDEQPDDEDDETAAGQHRWVLAIEDSPTGDGRFYEAGAFTWRDLPLPFMATDVTGMGHDGAKLVANIVEIERQGNEIIGITEHIDSDDEDVLRLQKLIDDGDLRGVSVDMDNISGRIEIVLEDGGEPETTTDDEGREIISIDIGTDSERAVFTAARIIGATALPFPAFAEAQSLGAVEAITAGAGSQMIEQPRSLTAAVEIPNEPPRWYFDDPQLAGPTPLTVTDDGRVFGHLALWDSCHLAFTDRCVSPPRSASSYGYFHSGEIVCDDGSRVSVGQITADSGHAALRASARLAVQHYDNTGWAAADVRAGDDVWGIWLAGALRCGLDPTQVRTVLAADVSGDWRRVGDALDLVAIASVNVPGFSKVQMESGERKALVASMPVCETTVWTDDERRTANRVALSVGLSTEQRTAARDRLAWQVGRHPQQQRDALAARVRS